MTSECVSELTTASANKPTERKGLDFAPIVEINYVPTPSVDSKDCDTTDIPNVASPQSTTGPTSAMIREMPELDLEPMDVSSNDWDPSNVLTDTTTNNLPVLWVDALDCRGGSSSGTTKQHPLDPDDPVSWPISPSCPLPDSSAEMPTACDLHYMIRQPSASMTDMRYEHEATQTDNTTLNIHLNDMLASGTASQRPELRVYPVDTPNSSSHVSPLSEGYYTPLNSAGGFFAAESSTHRLHTSSLNNAQRRIYDGAEVVISHPASSQYAQGNSVSACGLAALNFAKVLFDKEKTGMRDNEFLGDLMSPETAEEITAVCSLWTIDTHLEVEEIHEMPFFQNALRLEYTQFGQPHLRAFRALLERLETFSDPDRSVAVVITRPPEIIACIRIPTSRGTVFVIFDSHPRPSHPEGAGFTFNTSIEATATRLYELLAVDTQLFREPDMEWQAQLLGNFSGHIFIPIDQAGEEDVVPQVTSELILKSSMALLEERMKSRALEAQVRSLKQDIQQLENRLRVEQQSRQKSAIHARQEHEKAEALETENARLRYSERPSFFSRISLFSAGNGRREDNLWKSAGRSTTETINDPSHLLYSLSAENQSLQADMARLGMQMREDKARDSRMIRNLEEENQVLRARVESFLQKEAAPVAVRSEGGSVQTQTVAQHDDDAATYVGGEEVTMGGRDEFPDDDGLVVMDDKKATSDGVPYGGAYGAYGAAPPGEGGETAQTVREIVEEEAQELHHQSREQGILSDAVESSQSPGSDALDDEVDPEVYLALIAALEGSPDNHEWEDHKKATGSMQAESSGASSHKKAMKEVESNDDNIVAERLVVSDDDWWRTLDEQVISPATSISDISGYSSTEPDLKSTRKGKEKEGSLPRLFTFHCGICLEDVALEDVAPVEACGHEFCRDCLRGYIVSKLSEHRFPINCPICLSQPNTAQPGLITELLIEQVGIPESAYGVFTELQLAEFSVLVKCRGCQNEVYIDREEHEAATLLICPLSCGHRWCKSCQQDVSFGLEHSCNGAAELDYLLTTEGWKRCPGCQIPVQKIDGCNHMTCITPACNTHFCYTCGALIVKSIQSDEIAAAISGHYGENCNLFGIPADTPL